MIIKVRKDGKEENMYHILVCDDEKDIVSALKIYLTADGYEVFCAYNGKEALEVLEKEGLEGVQLFTNGRDKNGRDKIMKDYKIKGIPRFMVFDKKGNVVTINSPRPSNPELRKLLERELRK